MASSVRSRRQNCPASSRRACTATTFLRAAIGQPGGEGAFSRAADAGEEDDGFLPGAQGRARPLQLTPTAYEALAQAADIVAQQRVGYARASRRIRRETGIEQRIGILRGVELRQGEAGIKQFRSIVTVATAGKDFDAGGGDRVVYGKARGDFVEKDPGKLRGQIVRDAGSPAKCEGHVATGGEGLADSGDGSLGGLTAIHKNEPNTLTGEELGSDVAGIARVAAAPLIFKSKRADALMHDAVAGEMDDVGAMLDDEFAQLLEGAGLGDFEMDAVSEFLGDAQDGFLLLFVVEPRLIRGRARCEEDAQGRSGKREGRHGQSRGAGAAADGAARVGDEERAIRAGQQFPREIEARGVRGGKEQPGRPGGDRVIKGAGYEREENVPQLGTKPGEVHRISDRTTAIFKRGHEGRHLLMDSGHRIRRGDVALTDSRMIHGHNDGVVFRLSEVNGDFFHG
jgi:hypothetical protein